MLTRSRPTIDPCIFGSAIGDLFPENPKLSINLIVIKKEHRYYHGNQDKRVNP